MLPCALAGHDRRLARCSALPFVDARLPSVAMTEPFAGMEDGRRAVAVMGGSEVLHNERPATAGG